MQRFIWIALLRARLQNIHIACADDDLVLTEAPFQFLSVRAPPGCVGGFDHHLDQYHVVPADSARLTFPGANSGGAQVKRNTAESVGKLPSNLVHETFWKRPPGVVVQGQKNLN